MKSKIPKPYPNFQLEELDGEILLYHPSNTTIFYLNQTAALTWQLCDGNRSVGEIVSLLSDAYFTELADLPSEISAILSQFAQQEIVELV